MLFVAGFFGALCLLFTIAGLLLVQEPQFQMAALPLGVAATISMLVCVTALRNAS